jgi:hypothetical protein
MFPDQRSDIRQLIATANELLELAIALESTSPSQASRPFSGDQAGALAMARWEYNRRRNRARFFADDRLFGEPAWDILLDLFIAGREGKRVPVTSACIGAAVPTTTALRWLTLLEQRGLVQRDDDPTDARRALVYLTNDAIARMEHYFERAHRDEPR